MWLSDDMTSYFFSFVSTPEIPTAVYADDTFFAIQEDDVPHPVKVNNWANGLKVGQVAGVSVNPDDHPVIFHRGPVEWNAKTFNLLTNNLAEPRTPITEDTIVTLN